MMIHEPAEGENGDDPEGGGPDNPDVQITDPSGKLLERGNSKIPSRKRKQKRSRTSRLKQMEYMMKK